MTLKSNKCRKTKGFRHEKPISKESQSYRDTFLFLFYCLLLPKHVFLKNQYSIQNRLIHGKKLVHNNVIDIQCC